MSEAAKTSLFCKGTFVQEFKKRKKRFSETSYGEFSGAHNSISIARTKNNLNSYLHLIRKGPTQTIFPEYLFLMIWNDAADKVWVGVPQGGHELRQLLLVQLTHGAEHALASLERPGHFGHPGHFVQADNALHCSVKKGCGGEITKQKTVN